MGQVRKIEGEYYIEFYARGLLYQKKAGTDEEIAKQLLVEIESKIAQGEMSIMTRDVDIDIFFKTFLEYAFLEYPTKTYHRYRSLVAHFFEFIKIQSLELNKLSEITPRVIEDYRIYLMKIRKIKPRLINFTLYLLRDILDYSIKLGYLNDNPTVHIRFIPEAQRVNNKIFIIKDSEKIKKALEQGVLLGKLTRLLQHRDIARTFLMISRFL